MSHDVALLTPTFRNDVQRFELLCETIDRCVTGYTRHYVIVNDDDMHIFAKYATDRRVIEPSSKFLPQWLWPVHRAFTRNGRKVWISLRCAPVHGWHIQQLLKLRGALAAKEDRICIIDSDNLFFRRFDIGAYAGGETVPLGVDAGAISQDAPLHGPWLRHAHDLLGFPLPAFPADDYVGNVVTWDKATLRAMTQRIQTVKGIDWSLALCRVRQFSEYLLYGYFVANQAEFRDKHDISPQRIFAAHWDDHTLGQNDIAGMIDAAEPQMVALCVQSYSRTSTDAIRAALPC